VVYKMTDSLFDTPINVPQINPSDPALGRLFYPPKCGKCESLGGRFVPPAINLEAQILICAEAPGEDEVMKKTPLVGRAGKLLFDVLHDVGITRDVVSLVNVVECRPMDGAKKNRPPSKKEITNCSEYTWQLVDYLAQQGNLKLVIALGSIAVSFLTTATAIGTVRGQVLPMRKHGIKCLCAYHPAYILRNAGAMTAFKEDLTKIPKILNGDDAPKDTNHIETVTIKDADHLERVFNNSQFNKIAFDTETTGLDFTIAKIKCISFSFDDHCGYCIPQNLLSDPRIKDLVVAILTDKAIKKIWHNAAYDRKVMWANGLQGAGENVDDTMLMQYLFVEEDKKRCPHSLASLSYLVGMGAYKGMIDKYLDKKSKTGDVWNATTPDEVLHKYAALDAVCTYRLHNHLIDIVNRDGHEKLRDLYSLIQNIEYWLSLSEYYGIKIDVEYLRVIGIRYDNLIGKQLKRLEPLDAYNKAQAYLGFVKNMCASKSDKINQTTAIEKIRNGEFVIPEKQEKQGFNIRSDDHKRILLYDILKFPVLKKTDTNKYSCDSDTIDGLLKSYANTEEKQIVLEVLQEFAKYHKIKSTYIDGILSRITNADQLIHTSYLVHGTVTGRLSSIQPNLQNIPSTASGDIGKEIKRAFIARRVENILFCIDYSQAELRVLAHYSQDLDFVRTFREGKIDVHAAVAARVLKGALDAVIMRTEKKDGDYIVSSVSSEDNANIVTQCLVTAEERTIAKHIIFGLIYGRREASIATSIGISEAKAKNFIYGFFSTYSKIADWMMNNLIFCIENGYVESIFGRRRRMLNLKSLVPMIPRIRKAGFLEISKLLNSGNTSLNSDVLSEEIRQATNAPIQATSSDITLMAIVLINEFIKKYNIKACVVLTVHDSIVIEISKDDLVRHVIKIQEICENAVKYYNMLHGTVFGELCVPMKVDMSVNQNWGDQVDITQDHLDNNDLLRSIL